MANSVLGAVLGMLVSLAIRYWVIRLAVRHAIQDARYEGEGRRKIPWA
jgi:hypothetical protein